ncbi:transposable element Tc1 transposase [Trichonephila clavipes]|nr:transposable element Tc1 transposase [Trichonephila clavipes]
MTEKTPHRSVRAHYKQLSEFERAIGESLVTWVESMRPLEDAGKNGWTVTDFSVMRCLATNPASKCTLTIIEDVSEDAQGISPIQTVTIACHVGPQPGVTVWSAISFNNLTPFGSHYRHTYSTVVRRRHSENCFVTVPFVFIFQQDNARPHTARAAMNCLRACQTLPWLARSLDLSSIEHVWDMMGRRLHR